VLDVMTGRVLVGGDIVRLAVVWSEEDWLVQRRALALAEWSAAMLGN
jgi:hypothetical protein